MTNRPLLDFSKASREALIAFACADAAHDPNNTTGELLRARRALHAEAQVKTKAERNEELAGYMRALLNQGVEGSFAVEGCAAASVREPVNATREP